MSQPQFLIKQVCGRNPFNTISVFSLSFTPRPLQTCCYNSNNTILPPWSRPRPCMRLGYILIFDLQRSCPALRNYYYVTSARSQCCAKQLEHSIQLPRHYLRTPFISDANSVHLSPSWLIKFIRLYCFALTKLRIWQECDVRPFEPCYATPTTPRKTGNNSLLRPA
jgi:hypothetical protein